MNRGNLRAPLFRRAVDYRTFLDVVGRVRDDMGTRVLAYCLMPNHWHMLLWPREDDELGRFMQRVTMRHTQIVHGVAKTAGQGHLYQARYKSFPVSTDAYLLTVCRYIERNPVRAGLVRRAEDWLWSSFAERSLAAAGKGNGIALEAFPVDMPLDWPDFVNGAEVESEREQWKASVAYGIPLGDPKWVRETAGDLKLPAEHLRGGRPPKPHNERCSHRRCTCRRA